MPAVAKKFPVKFLFRPANPDSKSATKSGERYAYEIKKESGAANPGRYLVGISSGQEIDAHGDRMTDGAIDSMIKQAEEKDITLYVNHGKDFTRDIALLTKSEKTGLGEWWTEYRLYDENDNVPDQDKQEADKVWRQAMGLDPYSRPREFGFSIEGYIPEDSIRVMEKDAAGVPIRREISHVELDPGVSLVPKPAYTASIATAVRKALKTQKNNLAEMMSVHTQENDYFTRKYEIENAFRELIDLVCNSDKTDDEKMQSLTEAFDSYRDMIIPVLLTRPGIEERESAVASGGMIASVKDAGKIIKSLMAIKGESMEPDVKTILGDVIASLQMLQQTEDGSAEHEQAEKTFSEAAAKAAKYLKKDDSAPEGESDEDKKKREEAEAATEKSVAEVHKALGKYLKKDDAPAEDKKDEEKTAMKNLAKKLMRKAEGEKDADEKAELTAMAKKLLQKAEGDPDKDEDKDLAKKLLKEAEGNASGDVESMLEDVLPDEDAKEAVFKALGLTRKSNGASKVVKSLMPVLENLARQQSEQGQAIAQMIAAFEQPVQKGLATNLGNDGLMEKLKKQLGVTDEPTGKAKAFGETPIQKNRELLAGAFMQAVRGETAKAAAHR